MPSGNHVRQRACSCTDLPGLCLSDDERVTQLNDPSGSFRNAPRTDRPEFGMSVFRGEHDVEETFQRVTGRRGYLMEDVREVRVTTVGSLREAGFEVVHTPGRSNPDHCSIVLVEGGGDPLSPAIPWESDMCKRLDECFNGAGGVER